jgi:hypothetical protein
VGTALSLAVGGGLYGMYLNYGSRMASTQLGAKELLEKCMVLRLETFPNPREVQAWLVKAQASRPDIFAANAIVGSIAGKHGSGARMAQDIDGALGECARELQGKMSRTAKPKPLRGSA